MELLAAVVEHGSIGAAARALGLAQPTVSAQLRQLERRIGISLVDRTPRGSTPTAAGVAVTGWALDVLAASDRFESATAAVGQSQAARLRVSASMTIAEYLVPRWLTAFRLREPDVVVAVSVGNSERVALDVLEGAAEIGFIEGPSAPSGLHEHVVAEDHLVVVVAPSHRLARRASPIGLDELARCRLVLREPGSGTREFFERAVSEHGFTLRPELEFGSTSAIKAAVMTSDLVGVLSELAVQAEVDNGHLQVITVADCHLHRTLRAVWPAGRQLVAPASDFVRSLRVTDRPQRRQTVSR